MKVGIIGMGHVGRMMRDMLASHAHVVAYDAAQSEPYPERELAACDFALVCVDTPPTADGDCDTTNVREAVARLPTHRIIIKSTVTPGTTDELSDTTGKQLCFSPEYVGQSTYYTPYWNDPAAVPFMIFGGQPQVRRWFIDAWQPVLGPMKVYYQCTAIEAEIVKYMENAYFAMKVSFVNEFFEICQALGADWHMVREGWLLDPRVERMHTSVFAGARGFGGRCLPKDTAAIVAAAAKAGYPAQLLTQVLASNQAFRQANTDAA